MTPPGIAPITAHELTGLGIVPGAVEPGGVSFRTDAAGLYSANLGLRTAGRVLVRLAEFPARAFYELERKARRVPWGTVLSPGAPAAFRVTSRKSRLYHLDGIAERLAAAAGSSNATLAQGGEPDDAEAALDSAEPSQLFVVRVFRDTVTISADSSGALLHRRGYRTAGGKAPLRETLAAAMLLTAGYDGRTPLADPFAGSGTIPIEAALIARRIPPGHRRTFALERWPTFEAAVWSGVRGRFEEAIQGRAPAPILGAERDAGAVEAAAANAARAGVEGDVDFRRAAVSALELPEGPGLVATNPPYGVRLGDRRDLRNLYARLGAVVRQGGPGWTAVVLIADRAHAAALNLALEERWRSSNGGVPVRCIVGTAPA